MNTKPYNQKQQFHFPPRPEDLVPADHESRIINDLVDKLDFTDVFPKQEIQVIILNQPFREI